MRISFHPKATRELESSIDWYAQRSFFAARAFCVAIDLTMKKISTDPSRFAFVDSRHRCCSDEKFPFQIVFRHDADRIHVIAVPMPSDAPIIGPRAELKSWSTQKSVAQSMDQATLG